MSHLRTYELWMMAKIQQEDCKPCADRGRKTPATRRVDNEPWCEECFSPDREMGQKQREEAHKSARGLRNTGWFL